MPVKEKKQCIICLDTCKTQLNLQLNCECKYIVHYKCFNTWWKKNGNCIICKKRCKKQKKGQKYIKFKKKGKLITNIMKRRLSRYEMIRNRRMEELEGQLLERYYNNSNERINMMVCSKILQIFFYLILGIIIWILIT